MRAVPILMYHEISPTPHPLFRKYSLTPEAFTSQMDWLLRLGYATVSLDTLVSSRELNVDLPARSVIITFDDGFRDCVRYAPPILVARGFSATFFLVASLVGMHSRWLVPKLGAELPLAGWDDLRSLLEAGFSCGAHGLTHQALATVGPEECRRELVESKLHLESELGKRVDHLAYPHGSYTAAVRQLAGEVGYRSACSVRSGLSGADDDVLALRRVPVSGEDSLVDFLCRLRTAESVSQVFRRGARGIWRRLGR
jgi:peptidoglycan/xylan/chitin deacetylase (PgdA/CDA1 family)